jgi:hypothetical protein
VALDLVRMPPEISRGFVRVLDFGTSVVRMDFGGREVSRTREMPRRYWQATKGTFSRARIEEFCGFIQARAGAFHGFRFWDPSDCSTSPQGRNAAPTMLDQFLGYGDGVRTEFELRRVYPSTPNDLPQRRAVEDRMLWIHGETDNRLARCLSLPDGTVFNARFAFGVTEQFGFTINHKRRTVRFVTPPAAGVVVSGGAYYDWPVCLGEDADTNFEVIAESWLAGNAPNIPLECLPFERFAPETDDPGGCKTLVWAAGSPLLQKVEAKWWKLEPAASSLTVTIEEPSDFNSGGPHFVLANKAGGHSVDVKDELTGATIVTLAAGETGWFMLEVDDDTRNWFPVVT